VKVSLQPTEEKTSLPICDKISYKTVKKEVVFIQAQS
jgi:hypothetical protein